MDVREFPVLTSADRELVARLEPGLGEDAARVLAYLLRRREEPAFERTATRTAVNVGTESSKTATREALRDLVEAGVVAETTAETDTSGRPPTAWHALEPERETVRRVYEQHAARLLDQGERFDERTAASTGSTDDDDTAASDGLTVALNWRPNGLHLPLFAGRDAADVPIVFEERTGSDGAIRAVAAGEADAGVAGAATVLRERERGRPVVPIAVLFRRSTVVLYTTRAAFGGPFERIDQLRGRRLGVPPGTETALLGRLLLAQAGVRDAVEVVELEGEEGAALRSGDVDVVTGMVPDPRRVERAGRTVDAVAVGDSYPAYGPALVAHRRTLRDRRPALERLLVAAMAGWAAAESAPADERGTDATCEVDAAASAAATAIAERSDESVERVERTFRRASDRFGRDEATGNRGWGWHSPDGWLRLRSGLLQGDVLDGAVAEGDLG